MGDRAGAIRPSPTYELPERHRARWDGRTPVGELPARAQRLHDDGGDDHRYEGGERRVDVHHEADGDAQQRNVRERVGEQ